MAKLFLKDVKVVMVVLLSFNMVAVTKLYMLIWTASRGIRVGKYVKQGQTIGFVGSSGRATGPHLHYEFRVNGSHRNPLTVKLPNAAPIKSAYKGDFIAHAERLLSQLDTHKPTQIALNEQ